MKTQISSLINGQRYVRRDLNNPKYINCPKATSHCGYAGTNHNLRNEIAAKVIEENPNGMDIKLFGKQFHLSKYSSLSGKTVSFTTDISLDDFILISGYPESPFEKKEAKFQLEINNNMEVLLNKFCRASEKSQWRHRGYDYIDESFIEIL